MRRTLAFALALGTVGVLAAPAAATFPGENGLVVYSAYTGAGQGWNVYVVTPESEDPQRLTTLNSLSPTFNQAGTKIAFSGERPPSQVDDPGCDPRGGGVQGRA